MIVVIVFTSEGFDRLVAEFADRIIAGRAPHLSAGLVRAGRVYMTGTRARFFRASRGDGTWPDLAPSTKLRRLLKAGPGAVRNVESRSSAPTQRQRLAESVAGLRFPILYDSGRLFNSLRTGGPGYVERLAPPNVLYVGTSVPYAGYHQSGVPGRKLPQRVIQAAPDQQTAVLMEAEIGKGVEEEAAAANAAAGAAA